MNKVTRRSFLSKGTAAVGGVITASALLPKGWYSFSKTESAGHFETEFGITDRLCRKVLSEALSRGGDYADLFFEHSISNFLILEDGKVSRAACEVALGAGIRTIRGEQVGYGFTQDLSERAMLSAAATAATIAEASAKKPAGEFAPLRNKNYYPMTTLFSSVPLEAKLPVVRLVNEKCFSLSPLVIKVTVVFHDQQKRILVVTSDGVKAEDLQPRSYLSSTVVAEKNGRRERSSWNFGGRRDFSYYTNEIAEKLAQRTVDRALVLFDAIQPPAGEMPVVFGPGVTGVLLHEAIGHGMEADFNRKNISIYSAMLGKKVAEPFVTIVDEGTTPFLAGSINFDDEGTTSQKTILVEKGILTGYLHDRISARTYGVNSTGNGRRESYQHFVIPRMRNTYMLAGEARPEDLIKAAGKGIYVQDVSNGQVKIGEGDFAFYVSQGRTIENGKLGAPIKDINIMGNGPKMLANIIMLANDFAFAESGSGTCGKDGQSVPVGFGQPSCLVKSLTVGGIKS